MFKAINIFDSREKALKGMLNLWLSHIYALLRNDEQKQFRGTTFLLIEVYFLVLTIDFLHKYWPHISNKAPMN